MVGQWGPKLSIFSSAEASTQLSSETEEFNRTRYGFGGAHVTGPRKK